MTRDTIRIAGKDSDTVVVNTKTTTMATGTVNYQYPVTVTTTTYFKVPNSTSNPNQLPTVAIAPVDDRSYADAFI